MVPHEPIRKRTAPPGSGLRAVRDIPDKLYFRIGEVAKLCDVPAYVLRFWEGEFPQLKPNKGGTGQRLYRRRDVEMALRIKTLLYDEGYTIPGARQAVKVELRTGRDPQLGLGGIAETLDARHLVSLQKDLRELHSLLSKPPAGKQAVQSIRTPRPNKGEKATLHPLPRSQPSLVESLFDDPVD